MKTFQGNPCKKCKSTTRYISNGGCVKCIIERSSTLESKARMKQYHATVKCREAKMIADLERNYGLTPELYYEILRIQDYRCKICYYEFKQWQLSPNDTKRDTRVDHCHITRKVRGILCDHCNVAIGRLRNDHNHAANTVVYLREHDEPT